MTVEIGNRVVKIQGELLLGGFAAYSDTIKNWEYPHENEQIDKNTKEKIMNMVTEQTKNSKFLITFN